MFALGGARTSTTPGNSKPDNELQIRALIDGWAKAIGAKDIDAVMSHYAAGIVTFDLAPPLQNTARRREKGCLDQLANCTVSERLDAPIGDTAPASRLIIDDLLTLRKITPQP